MPSFTLVQDKIFTAEPRRALRRIFLLTQSGDGDLPARSRFGEGRLDQKLLPFDIKPGLFEGCTSC